MVYKTFIVLVLVAFTWEFNFDRTIVAVHFPYYKILLSLGECKNRTLYTEQQVWATVKLNRILDILYKSNDSSLVSRVEIDLIVNNTEIVAIAYNDVGFTEFGADILFPTHSGTTFYSLEIFSCSPIVKHTYNEEMELDSVEDIESLSKMPFYVRKDPNAATNFD